MMKKLKKGFEITVVKCLVFFSTIGLIKADPMKVTQETVEMADAFRAEGKIYVLTAIILIIVLGFFVYMFKLDNKVGKIEKLIEGRGQK